MTKMGLDVNRKPSDPAFIEQGVQPPIIIQQLPLRVEFYNAYQSLGHLYDALF